ncbi:rab-gap/tbc-related [Anaeramoeba flamelloides]|uniref:Rab-gap/tbc-related n=1 Tax=Anaeramoeba flamelloides TaxID=1746091 RepID=A0ABQ8X5E0_9EUKA|nr:rab-gap/tbc-related [Anaeramoeba flamelloides]
MNFQPNKQISEPNEFKQSQNYLTSKINSSTNNFHNSLQTNKDQNFFPTIKKTKPNLQQINKPNHENITKQTKTFLSNNSNNSTKKVWPRGFGKKRLLYLIQEEQFKKEMEMKKSQQAREEMNMKESQVKVKKKEKQTNQNKNQQTFNSSKKENNSNPIRINNQQNQEQKQEKEKEKGHHQTKTQNQLQKQASYQIQTNKMLNKKKPYQTNLSNQQSTNKQFSVNQNEKNSQFFFNTQEKDPKPIYSENNTNTTFNPNNLMKNNTNQIYLTHLGDVKSQFSNSNNFATEKITRLTQNLNEQVLSAELNTNPNPKTTIKSNPNKILKTNKNINVNKNININKNIITNPNTKDELNQKFKKEPNPKISKTTNYDMYNQQQVDSNFSKNDLYSIKNIQNNLPNLNQENQSNNNHFQIKQNSFLIKKQESDSKKIDSETINAIKTKISNENYTKRFQNETNNYKQDKHFINPKFQHSTQKPFVLQKDQNNEMDLGKNMSNVINFKNQKYPNQSNVQNKKIDQQELNFERNKNNSNKENIKSDYGINKNNDIIINKNNEYDINKNNDIIINKNNDINNKNKKTNTKNFNTILNNSNEFWNLERDHNERTNKNKAIERSSNNNKISQIFKNENENYISNKLDKLQYQTNKYEKNIKNSEKSVNISNSNNKDLNQISFKNLNEFSKNENEKKREKGKQTQKEMMITGYDRNESNQRIIEKKENLVKNKFENEKNNKKIIERKSPNINSQTLISNKSAQMIFKKNRITPNPPNEFKYYKDNSFKERGRDGDGDGDGGMGGWERRRRRGKEADMERGRGKSKDKNKDREGHREEESPMKGGRKLEMELQRNMERDRYTYKDKEYLYKREYVMGRGRRGEYEREKKKNSDKDRDYLYKREYERERKIYNEREYLYKREHERDRNKKNNLTNGIPTEREKYLRKENYYQKNLGNDQYFDPEMDITNDPYYDYDKTTYKQYRMKEGYTLEKNHYYDRNRYYNERRIDAGYSFNNNNNNYVDTDIYRKKLTGRYKHNERERELKRELPARRFKDRTWGRNNNRIQIRDPFLDKEYQRENYPLRGFERKEEEWDKEIEIERIRNAIRERELEKKRERERQQQQEQGKGKGKRGGKGKRKGSGQGKGKESKDEQGKVIEIEQQKEAKAKTETEVEMGMGIGKEKGMGRGRDKENKKEKERKKRRVKENEKSQQNLVTSVSKLNQKRSILENEVDIPNIETMIYVWPLESELTKKDEIKKIFSNYGKIIKIIQEKTHAMIQFQNPQQVKNATNSSKKIIINGKNVIIKPFEMWRIKNLHLKNTLKNQKSTEKNNNKNKTQNNNNNNNNFQKIHKQQQQIDTQHKKGFDSGFNRKRPFQIDKNELNSRSKSLLLQLSQLQSGMLNEKNINIKSSVSIIIRHHENFSQGLSIKSKIKKDPDLVASLTILPKHRFMDDLVQEAKNNGTNYIVLIEKNDSSKELQSYTLKINDFIKKNTKIEDNLSLDSIITRIKYYEKQLKSINSLNQIQFFNSETTKKLLQNTLRDQLSKNSLNTPSSFDKILRKNPNNSKNLGILKEEKKQSLNDQNIMNIDNDKEIDHNGNNNKNDDDDDFNNTENLEKN